MRLVEYIIQGSTISLHQPFNGTNTRIVNFIITTKISIDNTTHSYIIIIIVVDMDSCFGPIRIPKERDTNQDPNLLFLYFCPYCIDQIKSYCLVHISHYFLYFFNILYLCLVVNYFPNTSVRCKSMCINGVQMLHAGYSLIRGGRNPAWVRIHNLGDYPPVACFVNRANGDVHGSCAMTS